MAVVIYSVADVRSKLFEDQQTINSHQRDVGYTLLEYLDNPERPRIFDPFPFSLEAPHSNILQQDKPLRITRAAYNYIINAVRNPNVIASYESQLIERFANFLRSLEPFVKRQLISMTTIERAGKRRVCPKPWC
jgi:hypothetical protein